MSSINNIKVFGNMTEDKAALIEAKRLLNEEAAQNWHNEQWRHDRAQEMSETIYEGFQHENLLSQMAQVENLGTNGRSTVKEVRGLKAYWVAKGGYIESSTIHAEVMDVPRDTIGFHVQESEDKLETNFAETAATLVELGIQRLDAEVNKRALALYQAAVPNSSHDSYVNGTGIDLSAINAALRDVRDASLDNNVTIIGRSTMTEQIMDELIGTNYNGTGFIPATNEDIVRTGLLGTYRGARIVTLRNYKDDDGVSFFPANEMWVMSGDSAKFAFWGGLKTKEYTEPDNWYWHYIVRRDFGGVVHRTDRVRRIIDDSITA